jgi:hypothetical protein
MRGANIRLEKDEAISILLTEGDADRMTRLWGWGQRA